jgi:hypothetical protein
MVEIYKGNSKAERKAKVTRDGNYGEISPRDPFAVSPNF